LFTVELFNIFSLLPPAIRNVAFASWQATSPLARPVLCVCEVTEFSKALIPFSGSFGGMQVDP
jgi:hypothetical protein